MRSDAPSVPATCDEANVLDIEVLFGRQGSEAFSVEVLSRESVRRK